MGETVHVSLGTAANHVTSHLLNLQGLAATPSDDGGGEPSLCNPSVTHAVAPLDSGHVYVPRALIVDGRDSFGSPWGGAANNNNTVASGYQPEDDPNAHVCSWGGRVERFAAGDPAIFEEHSEQGTHQQQLQRVEEGGEDDPLRTFQNAASAVGLSPVHSRFTASLPSTSYNAGLGFDGGRHVQWDEEDEEEDGDYCYGQDAERREEERRRQQERTEIQLRETKRGWNNRMERAWEEAFYPSGDGDVSESSSGGNAETSTAPEQGRTEREIRWHDYWMPPRPSPARYQVPLPFDTANATSSDAWSSSFGMGYHPGSGLGGGIGTERSGITLSWRENVLSESLRRTLEGCDVVKGFNVFVDGGASASTGNGISGGFHAGLATSLLEELSEECRSAGRWAVLIAPPAMDDTNGVPNSSEKQLHQFRRRLNAGLALHGLSSNADAFLPASIDAAHRALRGDDGVGASPNRALFEGSAAVALALEASTLYYRLRRDAPSSRAAGGPRSRLGIQSGFYRGSSGNVGYGEADSEPFATAPSLTYHEFLASLRSSSDKRRSILELDALLRPLSYPGPAGGGMDAGGGASGLNMASLLAGSGSAAQASVLASLASAGLIGEAVPLWESCSSE